MNILVTGGAGFIGSQVCTSLVAAGNKVRVLDNLETGHKNSLPAGCELVVGDIRDQNITTKALKNIDAVIHMAGLIVVPDSVKDPITYSQNNVIGTVNLLNCMKSESVKKIIFSSSACVYGSPEQLPITEDAPLHPDNPYGASKAAVESFLQSFHASFGFDVVILRYFNPYGPGELHTPETHAIPNFIKATLEKRPIPLYWGGKQIRDFIYISDLVQAHVDVLDIAGFEIFNVGTETGVIIENVLELIFKIVGYKVEIKDMGNRPGDVNANYASSKKLEKEVGWKAKVSLEDGLRQTIQFFKINQKK